MGMGVGLVVSGFFYWLGILYKRHRLSWVTGGFLCLMFLKMSSKGDPQGLTLLGTGATAALAWVIKKQQSLVGPVFDWTVLITLLLLFGFDAIPGLRDATIDLRQSQLLISPAKPILLLILPWLVLTPVHPNPWVSINVPLPYLFALILFVTLGTLIPLAIVSGYARLGLSGAAAPVVAYQLAYNLVFVCVIEESFFRGLIQTALICWLRRLYGSSGDRWALLGVSLLFGGVHWGGGPAFVVLATLAGLGYGLVYYLTRRLEYAVFLHFTVNAVYQLFMNA
jgi:membrane protease YdiL (CAAX protease family)